MPTTKRRTAASLSKRRATASVQRYRKRMRRDGLRLIQLWVPDTSAPGFAREFRRQVRLVAASERKDAAETAEIDALLDEQDTEGWVP